MIALDYKEKILAGWVPAGDVRCLGESRYVVAEGSLRHVVDPSKGSCSCGSDHCAHMAHPVVAGRQVACPLCLGNGVAPLSLLEKVRYIATQDEALLPGVCEGCEGTGFVPRDEVAALALVAKTRRSGEEERRAA